jgi:phospholipid/cholesterol/gamma-HCH transport system ATP-binding protein
VVVTHDTRLARKIADRIMFLEGGQGVFFGTVAELSACADPFIQEFLREDELKLSAR